LRCPASIYHRQVSYRALELRHRRLNHLGHVEAIVGWDEAAMMPTGGGESRAEALATLRVLVHELATDPALGELFAAADDEARAGALSPWQLANLREMKRSWIREVCLPAELVEASSRADSRCEQAWRALRPKNDWASLTPLLTEVVARKREVAAALSAKLGLGLYDSLLDGFEPGGRAADIGPVFERLGRALPPLIQEIIEAQKRAPVVMPPGPFPVERQRWLGVELMKRVGFDFQHGRLDVSHHPFCGGVPRDVRITTRYDEADFTKSLMGVLHETGHAKYEQNLPGEWLDQPVGKARSMALHESQSLLQEMQVSRGRAFLELATPLVREAFPDSVRRQPEAFTAENLYRLYTRVQPGYIRVDADEATYPCHIILRFDLEQRLVENRMHVKELPEAWDAGMRALLGLSTAGNDKDGCMQDVHWPAGLFGYFPTYTLGALAAAQIFAAARAALPDLDAGIAAGDFGPLNDWLRARIWGRGSFLETPALLVEATGAPLGADAFLAHLRRRYLA
jgi:carboxypeptidase Taq